MISEKETEEKDIMKLRLPRCQQSEAEAEEGEAEYANMMDIVTNDNDEILRSDNLEVVSWGRGDFAALFRTPSEEKFELDPLNFQGSRRIIQIASNSYHSAALTSTGELYTCGSNEEGQVNPHQEEDGSVPLFLPKPKIFDSIGRHRISAVACGLYHTVCITATGSAISFGGNECGQLGHSPKQVSKVLPHVVEFRWNGKASHIIQKVACGDLFTLFLTASGEVYSCGVGENSGRIAVENSTHAERVDGMVGLYVTQIAAGSSHALALTSRGEMFSWGSNGSGQLGLGDDDLTSSGSVVKLPTKVPISFLGNEDILVGLATGYAHSLVWSRSGLLFCSGANKYGQLGLPSQVRTTTFVQVPIGWGYCRQAACGAYHSLALMQSTNEIVGAKQSESSAALECKVFGWGWNNFGQVSSSAPSILREALELQWFHWHEILYVAAGGEQSFAIGMQKCGSSSLMNRQFSTLASRALLPVDAGYFISMTEAIMGKYPKINSNPSLVLPTNDLKELLAAVQDIFSSPTILTASFMVPNSNPLQLDVLGVEECYKALLRVPSGGIVLSRLLQAVEQALGDVLQLLQGTKHSIIVPDQMLRFLLILWQCPGLALINRTSSLFVKMLQLLRLVSRAQRALLMDTLAVFPQHIFASRILKPTQDHLSHFIADNGHSFQPKPSNSIFPSASEYSATIFSVCDILKDFFQLNNSSASLVPNAAFYNDTISDFPEDELVQEFLNWRKSSNINISPLQLCSYPFLLSLSCKRRLFSALAQVEQSRAQQAAAHLALAQRQMVFMPYFLLSVRRADLVQDALNSLAMADDLTLKKPLKVSFDNEEGIDEGGVRKEFFQLIITQLLAPEYALFVHSNDGGRTLWLNKGNEWSPAEEWELLGKLLGLAVYNGVLLDLHLPVVLYKKLLGLPVGFDDLMSLDPSLHAGLKQLLEYEPAEEVEEIFFRTFEYEWEDLGLVRKVQLIPNGSSCPVTHTNRAEYVHLLSKWLLVDSLDLQFKHLLAGFHRVVHASALSLLRADELELLMAGLPHLNFHELQAGTSYVCGDASIGWGPEHPTVQAFWEVVHSLELDQKQRLLLFATGSAKAPIGGLRQVALQIQRMCPDTDLLPTAHTCFNMLMLPQYSDKNKLRDRLLLAINECEGFGLK